jgi:hypothetical protein
MLQHQGAAQESVFQMTYKVTRTASLCGKGGAWVQYANEGLYLHQSQHSFQFHQSLASWWILRDACPAILGEDSCSVN